MISFISLKDVGYPFLLIELETLHRTTVALANLERSVLERAAPRLHKNLKFPNRSRRARTVSVQGDTDQL